MPWYTGSHAQWIDGYRRTSRHSIDLVTAPGRWWRWRLRAGAVALAEEIRQRVSTHGRPDCVLVSSGVDVAALTGLARRSLGDVAVVAYLHDNQLAYPHPAAPGPGHGGADLDAAARSWLSLLAADHLVLNSEYHRSQLLVGLARLGRLVPHEAGIDVATATSRVLEATVVPVGVDLDRWSSSAAGVDDVPADPPPGVPVVLWNHRWDADKRPEVFVRAAQRAAESGLEFRVVLAGVDDRHGEPRRGAAVARLGSLVCVAGELDAGDYVRWLRRADVVVSVAAHENFGVSVVEAIAAGCVPVLPAALSYPDIVPPRWHDAVLYEPGQLGVRFRAVLADPEAARRRVDGLAAAMGTFELTRVSRRLDDCLEAIMGAMG